jgi:hypothetical protein
LSVPASPAPAQPHELFLHRAHREGKPVVVLRGVQPPAGPGVTVEAEVYPVDAPNPGAVLKRPYRFASADQAHRFVDEALTALEYLNCSIV